MASRDLAKDTLWRRGELIWKLDQNQKGLYNLFYNSNHKIFTWLLARRSGKSHTLVVLALEQCLRHPNSIVKYAAPTKNQIKTILRPLFKKILEDCPEDIRPVLKESDFIYYFPNGSEIQLAGTDSGHAEKLRGGDSHLAFVDEAGSCSDLSDLIKSILLPTTLTTKGKVVLAGTPSKDEDHDFHKYIEDAEARGSLVRKTIRDNPRLTQEMTDELIKEVGGEHTEEARRELFCELIKNSSTAVIPEFNSDLEKKIVMDWERPPYFDCYVSMDPGGSDLTGIIFGYFDYRKDKIIIEDEILFDFRIPGNTIKTLTTLIDEKEKHLWTYPESGEKRQGIHRVSDRNPILLSEIRAHSQNKISFTNTKKDDIDAQINNFRVLLKAEKIIINPRCVNLIRQLKNVKWKNKNTRNEFARSPDDGHYDTVAAGIYFIRNINFRKNPYPAHYQFELRTDVNWVDKSTYEKPKQDKKEVFKRLFNIKR